MNTTPSQPSDQQHPPGLIAGFFLGAFSSIFIFLVAQSPGFAAGQMLVLAWITFLTTAFFSVFVSMFVAIRGHKRQFIQSLKTRSILIGFLITPLSLLAANFLLESVGYGTPTLASPGLEIQLIAALISGEFLVRALSRPAPTYL